MNDEKLIAKYTDGEMSAKERTAFEKRLAQEPALVKMLDLYQDIKAFSDIKSNETLQATLKSLGEQHFAEEESAGKTVPIWRYILAAAATILLVASLWYLNRAPEHLRLYKQFAHTELSLGERGNPTKVVEMENLYNNKKYKEAQALILDYLAENPDDLPAKMALGICYLETEKYKQAETIFQQIKQGNSAYKWEATLNLALVYLKQGDKENYEKYLKEIPASSAIKKRIK